jgi:uridine kinase
MIIAHICGPTGSGKSTLGKRIKKAFPSIMIYDLDDLYNDLPKKYNEITNKVKKKKYLIKYILKIFTKLCNKYSSKKIIFVGNNSITIERDFSDQYYFDIDAKYKYFIDIDKDIVLKRRFTRHIEFMLNNVDHYFTKAVKTGKLTIDVDLWRKKINAPYSTNYYKIKNYKFMDNESIYKDIYKNLK